MKSEKRVRMMKWPGIVRAQVDGAPGVHCTYGCSVLGTGEGKAAVVQHVVTAGVVFTVHCTPRDWEGVEPIGHWFPERVQSRGKGAVLIVIVHGYAGVFEQYG